MKTPEQKENQRHYLLFILGLIVCFAFTLWLFFTIKSCVNKHHKPKVEEIQFKDYL
jgi:hypothetical protein